MSFEANEIQEAGSWDDLLEPGEDLEEVYEEAKDTWWDEVREEQEKQVTELPGETIRFRDTDYHIHPLPHGDLGLMRLDSDIRDFVREETEEFLETGEVYVEQDIHRHLGVSGLGVEELDDKSWRNREYPLQRAKNYAKSMAALPLTPVVYPLAKLMIKYDIGVDKEDHDWQVIENQLDSLEEIDSLADYENIKKAQRLPENLEHGYLSRTNPAKAVRESERSFRMADYMAHQSESEEVHALIGGGHYRGIIDRLNKYSDGEREVEEDFKPKADYLGVSCFGTATGTAGAGAGVSAAAGMPEFSLLFTGLGILTGAKTYREYQKLQK